MLPGDALELVAEAWAAELEWIGPVPLIVVALSYGTDWPCPLRVDKYPELTWNASKVCELVGLITPTPPFAQVL